MKHILGVIISLAFIGAASSAAHAASYAHSALVDTQAPVEVTGVCVSSYSNATFVDTGQSYLFGPNWYGFECRLKRNGTTVRSQLSIYESTAQAANYSATSAVLRAPRQNNCIYCTKNQGYFFVYFVGQFPSFLPASFLSIADKKDCDTTGYGGGGGGSGGEP